MRTKATTVLIVGNPVDGLRFVGPFDNGSDAVDFAGNHVASEEDWWISDLITQEEVEEYRLL